MPVWILVWFGILLIGLQAKGVEVAIDVFQYNKLKDGLTLLQLKLKTCEDTIARQVGSRNYIFKSERDNFQQQTQDTLIISEDVMKEITDYSLIKMIELVKELKDKKQISQDDLDSLEGYLFLGIPSVFVLRLLIENKQKGGLQLTNKHQSCSDMPTNLKLVNLCKEWQIKGINLLKSVELTEAETDYLFRKLLEHEDQVVTSVELKSKQNSVRERMMSEIVKCCVGMGIYISRQNAFNNNADKIFNLTDPVVEILEQNQEINQVDQLNENHAIDNDLIFEQNEDNNMGVGVELSFNSQNDE